MDRCRILAAGFVDAASKLDVDISSRIPPNELSPFTDRSILLVQETVSGSVAPYSPSRHAAGFRRDTDRVDDPQYRYEPIRVSLVATFNLPVAIT